MINNIGLPGVILFLLILATIWFGPMFFGKTITISGRKVIGGAWLVAQILATGMTIYTFLMP